MSIDNWIETYTDSTLSTTFTRTLLSATYLVCGTWCCKIKDTNTSTFNGVTTSSDSFAIYYIKAEGPNGWGIAGGIGYATQADLEAAECPGSSAYFSSNAYSGVFSSDPDSGTTATSNCCGGHLSQDLSGDDDFGHWETTKDIRLSISNNKCCVDNTGGGGECFQGTPNCSDGTCGGGDGSSSGGNPIP